MTDQPSSGADGWRFGDLRALYVIPEGAGTVNPYVEDRLGIVCRSLVQAGSRQPADGVRVERPQRSEDERPWAVKG